MPRYESEGTWFSAEERAKRERSRFRAGNRVEYHPGGCREVWFGIVDTVYTRNDGTDGGYMIRFEHDGCLRGRYYAEELKLAPVTDIVIAGIKSPGVASMKFQTNTIQRLRSLHANNDRRGLNQDQAFDLVHQYHGLVGELLDEPVRGEAQVAAEIADWLGAKGFLASAYNVRAIYKLHGL